MTESRNRGAVRVATLNCHCLIDSPEVRGRGIASEIASLDLNAIALQEVCETPGISGKDNFAFQIIEQLAQLGQEWEYRFARGHLSWGRWDEGVAILAKKGMIQTWGVRALPQGQGFPRNALWAEIADPERLSASFYLVSIHLTADQWTDRLEQSRAILRLVDEHAGRPHILAGDFNDHDWTAPVQTILQGPPRFTDTWRAFRPQEPGNTFPADPSDKSPAQRIDYLFVNSDSLRRIANEALVFTKRYQGVALSDHVGIFGEFELR